MRTPFLNDNQYLITLNSDKTSEPEIPSEINNLIQKINIIFFFGKDGILLRHNSFKELRGDKEILLYAGQGEVDSQLYAEWSPDELQKDKKVAMFLAQNDGLSLDIAPELWNDKDVVRLGVQTNGLILNAASEEIQGDKDIVKLAVQHNGRSLQFASNVLREDKEIVVLALKQNGESMRDVSESLIKDTEAITKIAKEIIFTSTSSRSSFHLLDKHSGMLGALKTCNLIAYGNILKMITELSFDKRLRFNQCVHFNFRPTR